MSKRWSGLRLLFTVLALAALSAVMAAACGEAAEEEAKEVAPAATQAPVVQAATAAPAAATAAPAMAATAAPVAQVATAAPAMAATAAPVATAVAVVSEDLLQTTDVPPAVQAILDELGLELYLPPAATTEPVFGGTIHVIGREPQLWDVHKYNSYRLRMSNSYTHQRLLRFAAGPGESPGAFIPIPSLAESWDIEDGGNRFVFHLRKGVKWHEDPPGVDSVPAGLAGRDVVASDWVFTFDRILVNPQASTQNEKLTRTVSWEAPDDYTFVVQNDQVVAGFLAYMAFTLFEALPPEMEELCGDYTKAECSNVGNGPWMYNSFTPGVSSSAVRNPDYWEQPYPYIDEVVQLFFGDQRAEDAAFRTGKLDIVGNDSDGISGERYRAMSKSNPEKIYASFPNGLGKRGIWMKQDVPPFNDINVRRAVALSLDRIGWVRGPLGGYGVPFGGPLAFGTAFWMADEDYGDASQWLKYDPAKAVALLEEAGYSPGDIKVDLVSTGDYGALFTSEAEVTAGFLNEIGMDVTMNLQDYTAFYNVWSKGQYDNLAYNFSGVGWVPEGWLYEPFHSTQKGTTHFGIRDPNFDALLDSYTQELDPARRIELVREAATHAVDQALGPLAPYMIFFYGQNPRIKNYQYNQEYDNGYAISQAWIDEG